MMTSKRILMARPDGGCSVLVPAPALFDGNSRDRQQLTAGGVTFKNDDEIVAWIISKGVPADATDVQIVDAADIPADRFFRNGWKAGAGRVDYDIVKCKLIAHDVRRARRAVEFRPHDEVIAKQVPGADAAAAEAARVIIRQKYDVMQASIDAATSVDAIKAALA